MTPTYILYHDAYIHSLSRHLHTFSTTTPTYILYHDAYTVSDIGSSEGTIQYCYHGTPEEPLQGSLGVEW